MVIQTELFAKNASRGALEGLERRPQAVTEAVVEPANRSNENGLPQCLDLSMCLSTTIASMMLDIVSSEGHAMLLQAWGRIDFFNSDVFEVQARRALAGADRDVIIDASGVTYLSTPGLRVLLHLWQDLKKKNHTLHICALRPYIQQVFEIIGFNQIIPNHADVAAALAAVESQA